MREAEVRETRTLVVPGHQEDRYPPVCDAAQRLERLIRQRRDDRRAIEDVPGMNDDVHLAGQRRPQRPGVVGQEVVSAPPALDPRPHRQIESEV